MRLSQTAATLARVAAVVLPVAPCAAQRAFEGTVTYAVTAGSQQAQMTMTSKGKRIRTETTIPGMAAGQSIQIQDGEKGETITIIPDRRTYMVQRWKDMDAAGRELREAIGDAKPQPGRSPKITRTGKKETIAGHTCEVVVLGDAQDTELCLAAEPGPFLYGMQGGAFSVPAGLSSLYDTYKDGMLMLRMRGKRKGEWQEQLVATRVQAGGVAHDAFAVPTGYSEMKMPSLGDFKLKLPGRKP